MNTVKHYKGLGLAFVAGDNVDDCPKSEGREIIPLSESMAARCNEGRWDFDGAPVGEFEWRKNTGEAINYAGEIEVEFINGYIQCGFASAFTVGADFRLPTSIKRWRPSLTQPKEQENPIFTQEMAEIKTITASSAVKDDVYTLLCMMHQMALRDKSGEWSIKSTATYNTDDYFMTTVTNGIVDLIAESSEGDHTYTMKEAEE